MNRAEKEAYLRDYELLKKEGKPFFPYAVMKDSTMALIVVLVIVVMALVLGAEQGPKADPTTTYVPRPEWYFFFLFELLRVIRPPALVPIATIGVPTIAMILLFLLPFDQRSYWATIVAMNITGSGPIAGPYLADFLRAGSEFGATTLPRFYAVHMMLVPGLIIALIGAHLYLVVKLGTTAPPWLRANPKPKPLREEEVGARAERDGGDL